jgi:hypothetical protein
MSQNMLQIPRRTNELYLLVLKPHRFSDLYPFQSDKIKTRRLVTVSRYRIDGMDYPFQTSERVVTGYPYQTALWKYGYPILALTSSQGMACHHYATIHSTTLHSFTSIQCKQPNNQATQYVCEKIPLIF